MFLWVLKFGNITARNCFKFNSNTVPDIFIHNSNIGIHFSASKADVCTLLYFQLLIRVRFVFLSFMFEQLDMIISRCH